MFVSNGTKDKVVTMTDFKQDARFASLRQVETYWESLRRGQLVPYRSEVDPRGIEDALSYAFIAERVCPGEARMRIAGTHLNDVLGMEVRGMPISTLIDPEDRAQLGKLVEEMFTIPAAITLRLTAGWSIGKPALEASLLLLPMRNDLGEIHRVLGCFESSGRIGRTPRRFSIADVEIRRLKAKPMGHGPRSKREEKVLAKVKTFAEAPAPFRHAAVALNGKQTHVPYLRVISDNDD